MQRPTRLERRIEANITLGICTAVTASAAFVFQLAGLEPLALFVGLMVVPMATANTIVGMLIERDIEIIRSKPRVMVRLPIED